MTNIELITGNSGTTIVEVTTGAGTTQVELVSGVGSTHYSVDYGMRGPNRVTTMTETDLNGFIYGNGTNIAGAVSGYFDNSHVNFASPDPIGSETPNTGAFTTLSATGTATLPHIHGSLAGDLYIHVKNTSGVPLTRGTPVYIVGNVGDTDRVEVAAADNTDPAKMPAVGLLDQDLANNGQGDAVILGELPAANTNAYSLNQELFVGVGALTGTKPTTGEVQSVGVVSRVQSNSGVIVVNMQGRRKTDVITPTPNTIALRNANGGLNANHLRLHFGGGTNYAQINPPPQAVNYTYNMPTGGGTIATNLTAVMLAGAQTIDGIKTFTGELNLINAKVDNAFCVITRETGDARYGSYCSYCATTTLLNTSDRIPIVSVTLPLGFYEIELTAASINDLLGGVGFQLGTDSVIKVHCTWTFGRQNSINQFARSLISENYDNSIPEGQILINNEPNTRVNLKGLLQVIDNNTTISLNVFQVDPNYSTTTIRTRPYIIAKPLANPLVFPL